MPFDTNSLWDVSHLVAFVGGAAVGAAGTYLADRFTDQRRRQEAQSQADAEFTRIKRLMPALIVELAQDLRNSSEHVLREFVVLHSDRVRFMHDKPRIEIYESKHSAAKNQVSVLVSAGYVEVVRSTDTPIYRLTEAFVERLANEA